MQKYHKDIGFLPCHVSDIKGLIADLKWRKLSFSNHALQELGQEGEAVKIGQFLRDYDLNFNDVFELAYNAGRLERVGFRVNLGKRDIIFILSREKRIITLWTNKKEDKHFTLNHANYCKV